MEEMIFVDFDGNENEKQFLEKCYRQWEIAVSEDNDNMYKVTMLGTVFNEIKHRINELGDDMPVIKPSIENDYEMLQNIQKIAKHMKKFDGGDYIDIEKIKKEFNIGIEKLDFILEVLEATNVIYYHLDKNKYFKDY